MDVKSCLFKGKLDNKLVRLWIIVWKMVTKRHSIMVKCPYLPTGRQDLSPFLKYKFRVKLYG